MVWMYMNNSPYMNRRTPRNLASGPPNWKYAILTANVTQSNHRFTAGEGHDRELVPIALARRAGPPEGRTGSTQCRRCPATELLTFGV